MSVQSMAWALEQIDISDATGRYVLLVLANYADKLGRGAFPSSASLSDDTGLSIRTIKYKLDYLLEVGAIKLGNQAIAGAYIDRHDRRPTVYDLCLDRGAPAAPGTLRGANDDATGCKSEHNGVQLTTERGAPAAPNPSLNHQVTTNKPKPMAEPSADTFAAFWSAYPKKKSKGSAEKAWAKLKPDQPLFATIIKAVMAQRLSHDWLKDDGKYIPHPATWLNAKKWEDEVGPAGAPATQSKHHGFSERNYHDGLKKREDGSYAF